MVDAFSESEQKTREMIEAAGGRSDKNQRRQRVAASQAREAAQQANEAKNATVDESSDAPNTEGVDTPSTEESK